MAECYQCGCDIAPGQAERRTVQTGYTEGFGLMSTRTVYSRVVLCPSCAARHDERERKGRRIGMFFAIILSSIALVIVLSIVVAFILRR
jgi:hypothetical protein